MMPGKYGSRRLGVKAAFEARSQYERGRISREVYEELMSNACPGAGSCSGLYTANSMACVTEALGLSLKMCASIHALDPAKEVIAFESGKRTIELVQEGVTVKDVVTEKAIENALGQSAVKEFFDLQPGDVPATFADVDDLIKDVGFKPKTDINIGIEKFIDWYKTYYKV